ncbi:MAG: AAC(3) family N-acetyltransferase [Nitrospira sp.]|nr:AAC(3) family N-acetyltransferase [Nitrospira sp.]
MLRSAIESLVGQRGKRALQAAINGWRTRFFNILFRYDAEQLRLVLRQMGIVETDTVLVHANFECDSGFQGTPSDLVEVFVGLLGEKGNVMMVTIPFRGSAYDYLAQGKTFHVKKTMSMMGLVTEIFRRRNGTVRSLHPTHPVAAFGKDSAWITVGHDSCAFPCGPGTPFEKLRKLKGRILFFDVGFGAITFFHYVEDLLKDKLALPVYEDRIFSAGVVGTDDVRHEMQTYAFTKGVVRDTVTLERELIRQGKLIVGRVGHSRLLLVTVEDVVSIMADMVGKGWVPYRRVEPHGTCK